MAFDNSNGSGSLGSAMREVSRPKLSIYLTRAEIESHNTRPLQLAERLEKLEMGKLNLGMMILRLGRRESGVARFLISTVIP